MSFFAVLVHLLLAFVKAYFSSMLILLYAQLNSLFQKLIWAHLLNMLLNEYMKIYFDSFKPVESLHLILPFQMFESV